MAVRFYINERENEMSRDYRHDTEAEPNMSSPPPVSGLVERLRSVVEISEPLETENCVEAWNWLVKQAHEAADALASERADHAETKACLAEALTALEWYGEQARLARLIHSEGDKGRHALAADGGKLARHVRKGGKEDV